MTKALQNARIPDHLATVFAGVDRDATDRARSYMTNVPPSSPSIALFRDGELVHMLERRHIEGMNPDRIAENLAGAFDALCEAEGPSVPAEVWERSAREACLRFDDPDLRPVLPLTVTVLTARCPGTAGPRARPRRSS